MLYLALGRFKLAERHGAYLYAASADLVKPVGNMALNALHEEYHRILAADPDIAEPLALYAKPHHSAHIVAVRRLP